MSPMHLSFCSGTAADGLYIFFMPQQLLLEVIRQAEQSGPAIQAAAFVHCARVMAKFDKPAAEQLLERGISLALSLHSDERSLLLEAFPPIVAGVNPNRAVNLFTSLENAQWGSDMLFFAMLDHGHIAEAVENLTSSRFGAAFPYSALLNAMADCRENHDAQRTMLRSAMKAIENDPSGTQGFGGHSFLQVFNLYWMLLPKEEAKTFLRALVQRMLDEQDEDGSSRFGGLASEVRFTSMQQQKLFEVFGPLRNLDLPFAESLLKTHRELAKAVEIFPYGFSEWSSSMQPPAPAPRMKDRLPAESMEWDFVNARWMPVAEWMKTSWEEAFSQAMVLLDVDTKPRHPNTHPHEVWPSTQEFRVLMYKAGRYEGRDAVARADRIPHPDVRLLAKIELIAGIVGLPQLGGMSRPPGPIEDSPGMQIAKASQAFTNLNLAALPIRWEGKGPAREVQIEFMAWDGDRSQWGSPLRRETSLFRRDGQLEKSRGTLWDLACHYDDNGRLVSIEASGEEKPGHFQCEYDDNARLVRVEKIQEDKHAESSDPFPPTSQWGGYSTSFVLSVSTSAGFRIDSATGVNIEYNSNGQPVALSYMRDGNLLCQSTREWDANGRLVSETNRPYLPEADFDPPSTELRYEYDSRGRCTTMRTHCGAVELFILPDSTFLYDDHDNTIESNSGEQHHRFEYVYDPQGNWTERVTWNWDKAKAEYVEVSIERRRIEYFS